MEIITINDYLKDKPLYENIKSRLENNNMDLDFIITLIAYGYTEGMKNQRDLGDHEIRIKLNKNEITGTI